MNAIKELNPIELSATIQLGIQTRAKRFYVARQLDGTPLQPV